ncbi:MAG: F5/8 type C domain protein, partial [uncultured Rubrobacteraceae bacterium]
VVVAEAGLGRQPREVHRRLLAPPALQLWRARQPDAGADGVVRPVQRKRGRRHQRSRPRLRAVRAPEAVREAGQLPRYSRVRRRYGREGTATFRGRAAAQPGPQRRRVRGLEADPRHWLLQLEVRPGGRQDLHRLRHRPLPL